MAKKKNLKDYDNQVSFERTKKRTKKDWKEAHDSPKKDHRRNAR